MALPSDPDPNAIRDELRARVDATPLYRWAGIVVEEASSGEIAVSMQVDERHLNLQGLVHGGMLATLADIAMGLATHTAIEPGRPHVTIELTMHFVRPAPPGRVQAVGRVIRAGAQIAFAESDVTDADGRLVARASGTYSVRRLRNDDDAS